MGTNAETESDGNGYKFFSSNVLWNLSKKEYSYHNMERIYSASKIYKKIFNGIMGKIKQKAGEKMCSAQ